jgi:hypothetical protein
MKRLMLMLLLCLIGAAAINSTALACDYTAGKASSLRHSCIRSTEIMDPEPSQDQVHAVVVDMPAVISLAYASPETWGDLPTAVLPYEQPSVTVPAQQLAMISD